MGAGVQYVQNWSITCGDMTNQFEFFIQDGTLNLQSDTASVKSYVPKNGNFKLLPPLPGKASSSSRSDVTLSREERTGGEKIRVKIGHLSV